MIKRILVIAMLMLIVLSVNAQTETSTSTSSYNTGSVYMYSGTLEGTELLKIKTYIWGQVRKPGLYIVPDDTDLLTLISSAGGPTENANLTKIRIIRSVEGEEKVMWVDLQEYIDNGDYNLIPKLQPGDTVIISGSAYYAFTKAVAWISQIAVILSVYISVNNIQ
ncbi:MAG: SLBB domain-containing protein [Candidatus Cloacimonetes bacterium]|nr:SLBB domain-containing protein [Candidatus Cloacimonadota bacterium]MCF7813244.1 SLBB domain-containing protein [Candidatus Cloacimonadota bacterium]MCF7867443.1 SLBB domain-containing protein [Candidatus Cloacimonadota bacterium]MCF7882925.1 SLBB domain-containing protein [Candidatus Cloacimonadota bacterium]